MKRIILSVVLFACLVLLLRSHWYLFLAGTAGAVLYGLAKKLHGRKGTDVVQIAVAAIPETEQGCYERTIVALLRDGRIVADRDDGKGFQEVGSPADDLACNEQRRKAKELSK